MSACSCARRPDLDNQLLDVITTNSQAIYASPNPTPNNYLVLRRSLTVLNQLMKELSAAKVPTLTSAFQVVRVFLVYLIFKYSQF